MNENSNPQEVSINEEELQSIQTESSSSTIDAETPILESAIVEQVEQVEQVEIASEVAKNLDDESKIVGEIISPVAEKEFNLDKAESEQPEKLTESQLLEKIAVLEGQIGKLAEEVSNSDLRMELAGENLEERIKVQEEFTDWVAKRRASYAWQVINRLKSHQNELALDEKLIKDFSDAEPLIPEGFGESTRKWFMKRFWLNFSVSWTLVLLLLLINRFSDPISTLLSEIFGGRSFLKLGLNFFLKQAIGLSLVQVIGSIFGFSLLVFIGHLFGYSRKNSEYLQLVAEENSATLAMENGIETVKEARQRIDSLHPQVSQILDVLSIGLHRPWVINDESLMFNGIVPDTSKLPACVEVAVPTIATKSPKYEELVHKAMNEIQIQGWREQAYANLIQSLAESIGFGANNMAVRELEEDQRKTGKRQLIASASENLLPATKIGEQLVEHFTRVVQEKVLPFAQPQVVSLRPDPLEGLHLDGSLSVASNVQVSNWEDKLAEIADLASPWSVASFSSAGTAKNRHQSVESIFIASERVPSREGVAKESAVNPGARPFEVAIRIDLSEWCKPDEVAIFSDFKPTAEQVERWSRGGSTHGANIHVAGEPEPLFDGAEDLVV